MLLGDQLITGGGGVALEQETHTKIHVNMRYENTHFIYNQRLYNIGFKRHFSILQPSDP